ncbi:MAG: hypothetical protein NZM37_02395 [Sandaracinaceae bacterium]|nr:hypothetical protein [Sandaracinaceae bacterium]
MKSRGAARTARAASQASPRSSSSKGAGKRANPKNENGKEQLLSLEAREAPSTQKGSEGLAQTNQALASGPGAPAPDEATKAKTEEGLPSADLDGLKKSKAESSRPLGGGGSAAPSAIKVEKVSAQGPGAAQGEFKVGEVVVYPARGVADIVAIEEKEIAGKRQSFYVLRVHHTEEKILVPVQNATQVGLRRPINEAQVREIFRILQITDVPIDTQTWNRRHRGFLEKLATGSIFSVAEVLRDLSRVKLVKENLSFSERQMLERARNLIVKEVAIARSVPEEVVRQEIDALFSS